MSLAEARQWVLYIAKRGPLNPSRHLEWGFALLASLLCTANKITIGGQKPTQKSFMRYTFPPLPADDVDASIDDVFNLLKGLHKNGK